MRYILVALAILLGPVPAAAATRFDVHIGINVPAYPVLQRIPGYPVYYAPRLAANYFFYDGLYWVFDGQDWYVSTWYNGPWRFVDRFDVPVFLLRVPVRYYRAAPVYFRDWRLDAPPRWDRHWGSAWAERRRAWDRWDRASAPPPAPLPTYQRRYSGARYPGLSEQVVIQSRDYRYQPREERSRERWREFRSLAEQRAALRDRPAPPAHAAAKGWPGKGHERALERDRPSPPAHAQAKGWPGKGHERALERADRERVAQGPPPGRGRDRDDHPGKGRGHDR